MAQRSKKDHIVTTALPLLLEQGFKGTSIDMVVRASGVSKPTVYNHFPDKSALMGTVLRRWVEDHKPVIVTLGGPAELDDFIRKHWLSDEAVRLYAIVIGEGWRFADGKRLFWEQYDRRWRVAFGYICERSSGLDADGVARLLDERLLERLRE